MSFWREHSRLHWGIISTLLLALTWTLTPGQQNCKHGSRHTRASSVVTKAASHCMMSNRMPHEGGHHKKQAPEVMSEMPASCPMNLNNDTEPCSCHHLTDPVAVRTSDPTVDLNRHLFSSFDLEPFSLSLPLSSSEDIPFPTGSGPPAEVRPRIHLLNQVFLN